MASGSNQPIIDVAVVGGGVIGMLSALELSERGLRVALYDAGESPASWAGGGILSPLFPWQFSPAANALCVNVARDYLNLSDQIRSIGGPDPEVEERGMLVLTRDSDKDVSAWAVRHSRRMSRQDWQGELGWWMPGVATVRNSRLLKGLRLLLAHHHVSIVASAVRSYRSDSNGVTLRTDDGSVRCGQVVLAAGWQTKALLPDEFGEALFPAKGQMLMFDGAGCALPHVVLAESGYLIPRKDGRIIAGSTLEKGCADTMPTLAAKKKLETVAFTLLPALKEARQCAHWAGVRPGCIRDVPIIDVIDEWQRVWVSTGHYRYGLTAAPGSARLLAQRMCQESPDENVVVSAYSSPFSSPGSSDSFCKR